LHYSEIYKEKKGWSSGRKVPKKKPAEFRAGIGCFFGFFWDTLCLSAGEIDSRKGIEMISLWDLIMRLLRQFSFAGVIFLWNDKFGELECKIASPVLFCSCYLSLK